MQQKGQNELNPSTNVDEDTAHGTCPYFQEDW